MATKLAKPSTMHTAGIYSDMTVDGPDIGTLVVVIDRAKNLPNRKTMGKQDPYCAARLGKEAKKTETDRRGGQTPKWDQELRFTVHDSPDYHNLKVSVFNDDRKTDLVGETWVNLEGVLLPGGGRNDLWQSLSCKGKYAGEIRIELTYYDTRPKQERPVEKVRETSVRTADAVHRGSISGLAQNNAVKRRPLPSDPTGASPSPLPIPDHAQSMPLSQPKHDAYHTSSIEASWMQEATQQRQLPTTNMLGRQRDEYPRSTEQARRYSRPLPSASSETYMTYSSLPLEPMPHITNLPIVESNDSDTAYGQVPYLQYGRSEDGFASTQNEIAPSYSHNDYIPRPVQRLQEQHGSFPSRDSPTPQNGSSYSRTVTDQLPPRRRQEMARPHSYSAPDVAAYRTQLEAARHRCSFYKDSQSVPLRQSPPKAYSYTESHSEQHLTQQPMTPVFGPVPPPPPAHRSGATPPLNRQSRQTPHHGLGSAERPAASPLYPSTRNQDTFPPENEHSPPQEGRYQRNMDFPRVAHSLEALRPQDQSPRTPLNLYEYADPGNSGPRIPQSPAWEPDPLKTHCSTPTYDNGERVSYQALQDYRQSAGALHSTVSVSPTQYGTAYGSVPSRQVPHRHHVPHPNRQSSRENLSMQPQYSQHVSRDAGTIVKPIPISPDARISYRINQNTPIRKSVSPQPTPSPQERPLLSGTPFSPDSFDEMNPRAHSHPSINQPGARYRSPAEAEEVARQHQRDLQRSEGPIIGNNGRVIDPSDHLPVDSWAPEPERKTPQKVAITVRARQSPRGAQPMPTATRQPLQDRTLPGQQEAVRSYMLNDEMPSTPGSTARILLQKRSRQSPAVPPVSSPLATSANGTPRSLPHPSPSQYALRERGAFGHNGSPSPGGCRDGSPYGVPPIPAKIPLGHEIGNGAQFHEMDQLSREVMSIDIGRGDDGRSRKPRYGY